MKKRIILYVLIFLFLVDGFTIYGVLTKDTTPATPEDFEKLESSLDYFQVSDKDSLTDITSSTLTLKNEECSITVKYDENFEVLSIDRSDHCFPLLTLIICNALIGIFLMMLVVPITEYTLYSKKGR